MKKIQIIALVLVAGAAIGSLSGCMLHCVHGSGHQVSENRKVGAFSRISISGGYHVILRQDSSFSIKITADDNLLKFIKTKLEGDELQVYNHKNFCNEGELMVYIGVKDLEAVKASGGVEVESDGTIHTKDLHFDLSGATKVTMELNADHITTSGSGATELNLKGEATANDVDISGVANVHAFDLVVSSCDIQTSGMGNCEVNVLKTLHIHSSGASDVKYKGNPSDVSNDKSGASSVEKVD
jgi:hypothetical protein